MQTAQDELLPKLEGTLQDWIQKRDEAWQVNKTHWGFWCAAIELYGEMIDTPSQHNGAREGYYWAYNRLSGWWKIVKYEIDEQGKDCYFCVQDEKSPNLFTRWLGPLPEPEG